MVLVFVEESVSQGEHLTEPLENLSGVDYLLGEKLLGHREQH